MNQADYTGNIDPDIISFREIVNRWSRLTVPVFQRNFVWNIDNAKLLTSDLDGVLNGDYAYRFLGTVVLDYGDKEKPPHVNVHIIDGQQRLGSLFLLVFAILRKYIDLGNTREVTKVIGHFLRPNEKGLDSPNQIKFLPRLADQKCFNSLMYPISIVVMKDNPAQMHVGNGIQNKQQFEDIWEKYEKSSMRQVSDHFDSYLDNKLLNDSEGNPLSKAQKNKILKEIYEKSTRKMVFCEIVLDDSLDEHEVFDRLNNAGVSLTKYDLLRNFLLQRASQAQLTHEQLQSLYKQNFEQFENQWPPLRSEKKKSAARDKYVFALANIRVRDLPPQTGTKRKTFANKESAYKVLKEYYSQEYLKDVRGISQDTSEQKKHAREDLAAAVKDVKQYKMIWDALAKGDVSNLSIERELSEKFGKTKIKKFKVQIGRFKGLERAIDESSLPFILEIFDGIITERIKFNDGIKSLKLLDTFFTRRSLLGEFRKGLDCLKGLGDLITPDGNYDLILNSIPSEEWVRDATIKNLLTGKHPNPNDLYTKSICRYVVWQYEQSFSGDRHPGEFMPSNTHVDHVIPRSALSRGELWRGWSQEDFEMWVHKWPNLIPLTGPGNQTKGTKSWAETRRLFNKGANCTYSSASKVFKLESWNPQKLEERGKDIAKWVTGTRWKLPDTL